MEFISSMTAPPALSKLSDCCVTGLHWSVRSLSCYHCVGSQQRVAESGAGCVDTAHSLPFILWWSTLSPPRSAEKVTIEFEEGCKGPSQPVQCCP